MADSDSDQGASSTTNPAITYTRTRKTKTSASSTRRRNNIPLCHSAAGGGGGNADTATGSDKSWFSRKASGWTDDEIRSHLVSSGASKGGGSLSMEGDLIQGAGNNSTGRKKKRSENKRRSGPRFAWEEEEEDEGEDYHSVPMSGQDKSIMRAAPTLQDIMDEQDQIDLLAPKKLGKDYQPSGGGDDSNNDHTRPNRQTNAALAEIVQFYENNDTKIGTTAPIATTADSIGWRLLRVLGYRSRLGMAFVSLPGLSAESNDKDQAYDLESKQVTNNLSAKHLASKGLRAIRLPSIAQNTNTNEKVEQSDSRSPNQRLVIPPPKMNKHGIGYDPFKNAPEFRAFHEKRRALAQKRGRAPDKSNDSRSTAYFTDNLRRDDRQSLWDKKTDNDNEKRESNQRSDGQHDSQHMNYAAQDYTDFIGTKASSGFALEDEDDANVYQDDEHDGDGFPKSNNNRSGYNLEIHSPVASEDEDDNNDLFHDATASRSIRSSVRKSREGEGNVAGAWDAWGMGVGDSVKSVTSDGKPPLPGFQLGQQKNSGNSIKRWTGPMVPSGYVLQRHTFPAKDSVEASSAYTLHASDCGLGLDLQHRTIRQPSRASVPTVLPHSERRQQSEMRARDGTELNFNAVRESMKNRFVSSNNGNVAPTTSNIEEDTKDDEEWINVSSTGWMPSRLLCKRWGISLPSTAATASTNVSTGRVPTTGEEAYFNETVLLKQKGNEGKAGSIIRTKSTNTEEDNYMLDTISGDTDVPPPHRPSYDVFKSIFDAGFDMEISSSEDEDDQAQDVVGEMRIGNTAISNEPTQKQDTTRSDSSSPDSVDSRQSRRRRNRRKRKHRRRRSPSNSGHIKESREDSDNSMRDEYDKKRNKKKKRHKHKRSHSRHKEKRIR